MLTTGRWNRWLAAGLMVVGVALIVFWTRPTPLPEFPTSAEVDDQGLQGLLAYVTSVDSTADSDSRMPCVRIIDLSNGSSSDVICRDSIGPALAWTEDGRLVVRDDDAVQHQDPHSGRGLLLLDPAGSGIPETVAYDGDPEDFWPSDLHLRDDGSVLVLEEAGSAILHRTPDGSVPILEMGRTPSGYSIFHLQWSPDGRYFMAVDTDGRVIIAESEGDPRPRVVVYGVEPFGVPVAWYIEGHPAPTVPLADLIPH